MTSTTSWQHYDFTLARPLTAMPLETGVFAHPSAPLEVPDAEEFRFHYGTPRNPVAHMDGPSPGGGGVAQLLREKPRQSFSETPGLEPAALTVFKPEAATSSDTTIQNTAKNSQTELLLLKIIGEGQISEVLANDPFFFKEACRRTGFTPPEKVDTFNKLKSYRLSQGTVVRVGGLGAKEWRERQDVERALKENTVILDEYFLRNLDSEFERAEHRWIMNRLWWDTFAAYSLTGGLAVGVGALVGAIMGACDGSIRLAIAEGRIVGTKRDYFHFNSTVRKILAREERWLEEKQQKDIVALDANCERIAELLESDDLLSEPPLILQFLTTTYPGFLESQIKNLRAQMEDLKTANIGLMATLAAQLKKIEDPATRKILNDTYNGLKRDNDAKITRIEDHDIAARENELQACANLKAKIVAEVAVIDAETGKISALRVAKEDARANAGLLARIELEIKNANDRMTGVKLKIRDYAREISLRSKAGREVAELELRNGR